MGEIKHVTEAQLQQIFLQWEQDFRDGKTRSHEESDGMPIELVATERAEYVWSQIP